MTAMVTPFDGDLRVDYKAVGRLTDFLIAEGSESLLVCGTTGEAPTLTHDEKLGLFREVVRAAAGRVPVLAGTGGNDTASTVTLTREAETCGVDGILVVSPYYNKPPQEGLFVHFKAVAEATRLPVIIYNIPGRTAVNLEVATLARLAELPNVVGVKEASGSMDQVSETVRVVGASGGVLGRPPASPDRKAFWVFSGDDSLTLPMLAVGATGVVSVASHVVGRDMNRMVKAFLEGQTTEAASIHRRLLPLLKGLFVTTSPIPIKAALKLRGLDTGGLRSPLVPATETQIETLRQIMLKVGALS